MKRMCVVLCLLLTLLLLPRVSAAESKSKTESLHSLFTTADLMDATVAELLTAMEAGRLTSVQLTQMYLDRIEAYDKSLELNSIISINPDALAEAEAADAARANGEALGRLHGIPVIVKDNIDVAGMATTSGDVYRSNDIAFEDAAVVARLKAEGGYTACLDENGLEGKRIGYLANSFGYYYSIANGLALSAPTEPDEKIVAMYEAAKAALAAGGAELVDLSEALTEVEISSMRFDTTTTGRLYFRDTVTSQLEELDIDAVLYVSQTDVPELEPYSSETPNNDACYTNIFGPLAGLPDIVLPMGLSDTDADTPYPLALDLSLFSGYGNDDVLIEIAYAYEQLTDVRVQPWMTPALPDPALAFFAEALISDSKVLLEESGEDEALRGVLAALEGLTMELADEEDIRTVVDAVTYYDAAEQLAAAYDARQHNWRLRHFWLRKLRRKPLL